MIKIEVVLEPGLKYEIRDYGSSGFVVLFKNFGTCYSIEVTQPVSTNGVIKSVFDPPLEIVPGQKISVTYDGKFRYG